MGRTKKAGRRAETKKSGKSTPAHPAQAKARNTAGNHAKTRHVRDRRGQLHVWDGKLPSGLVAKPIVAQTRSKHRSYFEFVENTHKKKKLEFTVVIYPSLDRIVAERRLTPR